MKAGSLCKAKSETPSLCVVLWLRSKEILLRLRRSARIALGRSIELTHFENRIGNGFAAGRPPLSSGGPAEGYPQTGHSCTFVCVRKTRIAKGGSVRVPE
jgi:hypothetical protein